MTFALAGPAAAAPPEVAEGGERPASAGEVACSFTRPICVHASGGPGSTPAAPGLALRALGTGERTLAMIDALGLPRPLGGFDLYLDGAKDADVLGLALDVEDLTARPFDRAAAFATIPAGPRWARGCAFDGAVARAIGFGTAMGIDAGMERGAASALASYVERLTGVCPADDLEGIDAYQMTPWQPLLRPDPSVADGGELFAGYLDDAYGSGSPAAVLAGLLTVASQRTPAGRFAFTNEPDVFDALRQNLRLRGGTLDGTLLDFAIARAFVGSRDDALHLGDAARAGDFGRVRFEWVVPFASLPRRFAPTIPIEPTGASYFWIDLTDAPIGSDLTLAADWEVGVLFRWAMVKIDAKGAEVGRAELPGVNGDFHAQKTMMGLDGLAGVLVVGVNVGSIDRSRPYDPDDEHGPSGFTVTFVK